MFCAYGFRSVNVIQVTEYWEELCANKGLGVMVETFWKFNPGGKWLEWLSSDQAQCLKTRSRSGHIPVDTSQGLDKTPYTSQEISKNSSDTVCLLNPLLSCSHKVT